MTVYLKLSPETERVLKERAVQAGRTLEAYLEELVEREAQAAVGDPRQAPGELDEFERQLDALAEGLPSLPTLPADFARADIYGEHA